MEALPFDILLNVFKYSETPELLSTYSAVSKNWNSVCESRYLLQYVVMRDLNLKVFPNISNKQAKRVLKNVKVNKAKQLEIVGFITSGGVDENDMEFWCANLFRSKGEAYCAHDNSENSVVGGVLLDSLTDPRTYFESQDDLHSVIQDYLKDVQIDTFKQIALANALELLGLSRKFQYLLEKLIKGSEIPVPQLAEVIRTPQNNLLLQHKLDLQHAADSGFFAVVKGLKIARHGHYTCPVKSLIVFISEEFIDVTSPEFAAFDNIKSYKNLKEKLEANEEMPGIFSCFQSSGVIKYCEFVHCNSKKAVPIAWVKFKSSNKVFIKLNQYFTGKYVYVKLLYPEDNREADDNGGINIDCRYVIPYGNIINLGKEI